LRMETPLLEVMSYASSPVLHDPALAGLRQALREGWIGFFRLTFWADAQIEVAAGLGLFQGPRALDWLGGERSDQALASRAGLPRLRDLSVGGSDAGASDEGLAHLAGLVRLEHLSLWSWQGLTGSGLAHLSGLTSLRYLSLYSGEQVTDDALAHLSPFV